MPTDSTPRREPGLLPVVIVAAILLSLVTTGLYLAAIRPGAGPHPARGAVAIAPQRAASGDPDAPSPGADAVRLVFRFTPGEENRYHVEMVQLLEIDVLEAPFPYPGDRETRTEGVFEYRHTVQGLDEEGRARVTFRTGDVRLSTHMLQSDHRLEQRLEGGRFSWNLGAEGLPEAIFQEAEAAFRELHQQSLEMLLLPSGRVLPVGGSPADGQPALAPGSGGVPGAAAGVYGMLILPEHPVGVGDSWQEQSTLQSPERAGAGVEVRTTYRFKELVERDGRSLAVIESDATARLRGVAVQEGDVFRESLTAENRRIRGTVEFDIEGGYLVSARYESELEQAMRMEPVEGAAFLGLGADTAAPFRLQLTGRGSAEVTRLQE